MPACRPKPVLRKSLATGGRGRGRARDAGQPAAVPGARQHGEAAGVTAPHPGQAGDEPAGGRAEQAAGSCSQGRDGCDAGLPGAGRLPVGRQKSAYACDLGR